jgi:hypothetical protein
MKKLFFITGLMLLLTPAFAQKLAQIIVTNSNNSNIISFLVDETVMVNITPDGKIIEWGVENSLRSKYYYPYPAKLDKYMGKEEYYPTTANDGSREKIKYIGSTVITYYSSDDNEKWTGKLKTIGPIFFDYYASYEDTLMRGKIKNAGAVPFTWYGSFDDAAYKGKLKSVGSTSLTYYSSFDDKAFRGKIKSIDRQSFVYYSSYDRKDYSGSLKTGYRILLFGGIKYFVIN